MAPLLMYVLGANRYFHLDKSSRTKLARKREFASGTFRALLHSHNSEMSVVNRARAGRFEPPSVIPYAEAEETILPFQLNFDRVWMSVFDRIGQSFLGDAKNVLFDVGRQLRLQVFKFAPEVHFRSGHESSR